MNSYVKHKQITFDGHLLSAPLKPCPWCKKTPSMDMPLDRKSSNGFTPDETWVWKIYCECRVNSEAKVSIRNTNKTHLDRFLEKVDELFDKWNGTNDTRAYEKKVLDLRKVTNLELT